MTDPYEEYYEGELILRLPPGERHETILQRLHSRVAVSLQNSPQSKILSARSVVQLSAETKVRPDLALLTTATGKLWLAVEIVNSGDHSSDTVTKKMLYETARIPRLWMVDPRYDNVEVYHGGPHGLMLKQILATRESLVEPLLPGLDLRMDELFGQ
jgi:Uma2 family endonuclease